MRKIRDVLRYRHSTGLSLDAIAGALNLSKGVVAKYLRLASACGLTWPLPEALDDSELEKRLYRQASAREPTFAEPDYALVHQELKKKGVTLTLLWEEYRQAVGERVYQYTAFCTHYKDWTGQYLRGRSGRLKLHLRLRHHRTDAERLAHRYGTRPDVHRGCIALANGTTTRVLVPQLYVHVQEGEPASRWRFDRGCLRFPPRRTFRHP